ncbi:MAG TPA: hypothetical protein VJ044_13260, partial [Candidatus Hodarchaeales archaeon]|nr:hypothetical protein [Candidatus Hodarchaeales archaeon]
RVRLISTIPDLNRKESARISLIDVPKSVNVRFIGFDPRTLEHQAPTFQGTIKIPIKLHMWTPKTGYCKENRATLRVERIEQNVGVAPFQVQISSLGHYFESYKDSEDEIIITVSTWLMSPDLLDSAVLEFSLTLIGEERVSERTFYGSKKGPSMSSDVNGVILPIWSTSSVNFKIKLKLNYDVREFERAIQKSLNFYSESLKMAMTKSLGIQYTPGVSGPTILPSSVLEILKEARYLSRQSKEEIAEYMKSVEAFHKAKQSRIGRSDRSFLPSSSSRISTRLLNRIRALERIFRTYERISLEKLASMIEVKDQKKLLRWLQELSNELPIRIQNREIFIDLIQMNTHLFDKLDQQFVELELGF